jgi:hypothetical protein
MQTNLGDGSAMNAHTHEFVTRPALLRKAVEFHQSWIETTLGISIADVVIFQLDLNLAQVGVEKILACSSLREASRAVRRLHPLVASADTPPGFPPLSNSASSPIGLILPHYLKARKLGPISTWNGMIARSRCDSMELLPLSLR